jgi:hypothetical protein
MALKVNLAIVAPAFPMTFIDPFATPTYSISKPTRCQLYLDCFGSIAINKLHSSFPIPFDAKTLLHISRDPVHRIRPNSQDGRQAHQESSHHAAFSPKVIQTSQIIQQGPRIGYAEQEKG